MEVVTASVSSPLTEHPLHNTGILTEQVEKLKTKKKCMCIFKLLKARHQRGNIS